MNNTNIQKGDIVRCVNAPLSIGTAHKLHNGGHYTVNHIANNFVSLKGIDGGWLVSRFEFVERGIPTVQVALAAVLDGELSPQCAKVLQHLRVAGSITQREALLDHGVQSLTKRISEMRTNGIDIRSERKVHPLSGQRYMRYALARPEEARAAA